MGEMQSVFLDGRGGVVRATGGALVPSESHWCATDFWRSGSEWACRTIKDAPGNAWVAGVDGS